MGAGKTYTALKLAQDLDLKILVVAPVSTLSMWTKLAKEYAVELVQAISYASLRGTKNGINHDWLDRSDDTFWFTQEFEDLVQEGVLLVFDEVHNLKNKKTSQIISAHTLAKGIRGKSRIALLSATPCDKPAHVESIFKMLRVVDFDSLYTYERTNFGEGEYILTGFKEIINKSQKLNPEKTKEILEPEGYRIPITRRNADKLAYQLYTELAKYYLSSDMSRPQILAEKDAKNGFYRLSSQQQKELKKELTHLKKAVGYNSENGEVDQSKGEFGALTRVLQNIEKIKVETFARLVTGVLEANPKAKAVVFMFYKDPMKTLYDSLIKYKPMKMDGQTKAKDRDTIVSKFQEDNSKHRLLITQIKVGGIGISLDDRNGNYPRYAFITPTYFFIDLYQATGRIYRTSTMSTATIRMVYGYDDKNQEIATESKILDAMARKSEVAKNMLANPEAERMPFPGEYEDEYEV